VQQSLERKNMKRLIILFLLAYATSSFAQVPFEVSKSCFVVNGRNITEPCLLSSTNNSTSNFERLTLLIQKFLLKNQIFVQITIHVFL
jgi:hypothetical protein